MSGGPSLTKVVESLQQLCMGERFGVGDLVPVFDHVCVDGNDIVSMTETNRPGDSPPSFLVGDRRLGNGAVLAFCFGDPK